MGSLITERSFYLPFYFASTSTIDFVFCVPLKYRAGYFESPLLSRRAARNYRGRAN